MEGETHHVVVVGGSFAGLAAAIQLGRARRRVVVVDSGRPRNRFAPASHGFPGQDGRSPADILDTFRAEVLAYPTVRFQRGEAADARRTGDGRFELALSAGGTLVSERLILATGVVDELPAVPGLQERWGRTVLHCPYCHGYEVRDRRLGVLATAAATAVHQGMLLRDWSDDVVVFANGVPDLTDDQRSTLRDRGVRIEDGAVEGLAGSAPELEGVRLRGGARVAIDALFVASRTRLASPLAERLGCALDDGPFGPIVRTDGSKETTVPGVYCAGDAARAPHNATWAAADGAMAGVAAHRSLVYGGSTPAGGR